MLAENLDTARSRRVAAAARLLLSDKPGEVVGAVRAIGRMLPQGVTVPDLIERAVTLDPRPVPGLVPGARARPFAYQSWKQRTRMALTCPHLTDWEREFLGDVVRLSTLTAKQEGCLKRILSKIEGAAA